MEPPPTIEGSNRLPIDAEYEQVLRPPGRIRSFWRNTFRPVRIRQHTTQDIRADRPVFVEKGAVVAGNIIAPRVVVAGMLYGHVVTGEATVRPKGQVWGDIHACAVQVEAGGVVHGWLSELTEAQLAGLLAGELPLDDILTLLPDVPAGALPSEIRSLVQVAETPPAGQTEQLALLRFLQMETASALTARAELERKFEQRLAEVAGDTLSQARALKQALDMTRDELDQVQLELAQNVAELQQRTLQVAQLQEEIGELRLTLEEQHNTHQDLQVSFGQKVAELGRLLAANELLEERVQDSVLRSDVYASRVENLESALQASLQRTAEQEEALLRWQELAEVTQQRVVELQAELHGLRTQATESERVIEMLRQQRLRAEEAWAEVNATLEEVLNRPESVAAGGPAGDPGQTARLAEALAEADQKIMILEQAVAAAEESAQGLHEQLLWHKATEKSTSLTVVQLQSDLAEREEALGEMQAQIEEYHGLAENWKNTVARMSELMYAAEQRATEAQNRVQALETQLAGLQDATSSRQSEVNEKVRKQALQLEAVEAEVEYYHKELQRQGKRLSEVQAEMADALLAAAEAQALLEERTAERDKIKQAASQRIRALEGDLTRLQRQLADVMAWAERKRGKE